MEERLGKITQCEFGMGGYQDAEIGLSLTFTGQGWGVSTFEGFWAAAPTERCEWSTDDQSAKFAYVTRRVRDLLKDGKVLSVSQLLNKPVRVEFEGNKLAKWWLLTEVI